MPKYRFHWLDGKSFESEGDTPAQAMTHAGYGNGAVKALDYYEEVKETKQYVVLEGLKHGNRFYTNNDNPTEDHTKLRNGKLAYKVLGFANTPEEAQLIINDGKVLTPEEHRKRLLDYLIKTTRCMFSDQEFDEISKHIV